MIKRFYLNLFELVFTWQIKYDKDASSSYLRSVIIISVIQLFNIITIFYLLSLKLTLFSTINKNLSFFVAGILILINYFLLLGKKDEFQFNDSAQYKKLEVKKVVLLSYIILSILIGAGVLISKAGA